MKGNGILVTIIVLISLYGSYIGVKSLVKNRSEDVKVLQKQNDRLAIIKGCKENSGELTYKHPEIIDWYCNCMADTLLKYFTHQQLEEQNKMNLYERTKLLEPLLRNLSKDAFQKIEEDTIK